jgi:hypothetical protein
MAALKKISKQRNLWDIRKDSVMGRYVAFIKITCIARYVLK